MIIEINNLSQEIKSSYQYIISGMDVNNVWLVTNRRFDYKRSIGLLGT